MSKPSEGCIKECGWKYDEQNKAFYREAPYQPRYLRIVKILQNWDKNNETCPNCGRRAVKE